jgi:uncharacterized protein with NRDE domain
MCTVTIFPKDNSGFVLTSNRDEAPNRTALYPDFYTINDTEMLLPIDEASGGSWIGVSNKNRVICLLNGGFVTYKRQKHYRQSRGVVVKDLLAEEAIEASVEVYDFNDIEPFTIVIADWNKTLQFYELVWDGLEKHFTKLPLKPKIWSSSTLYSEDKKQTRLQWFNAFKCEKQLTAETILEFHETAGEGNTDFGAVMDRGYVKTTSITQVEKGEYGVSMRFENLNTSETVTEVFNLLEVVNE